MKRETIESILKDKLAEGITAKEIIDAIMAEHGKDVEAVKAEKDKVAEQLKTATDSLKSFEGVEPEKLTAEIKKLEKAIKDKDKEFETTIANMKFDGIVESAITKASGKNTKAIRALLDIEELKKSTDQSVDIEKAISALKESDAYLFDSDEPIKNPTAPTGGTGDNGVDDLRAAMGLDTE